MKLKITDKTSGALKKESLLLLKRVFKEFKAVTNLEIKKRIKDNKNAEISLILVNDREIAEINKEYRHKAGPTDVISFAYLDEKTFVGEYFCVGDVFISIDTAKRQAKEKNHTLNKELCVLFTHGLLHLFGFDHNDDEEEAEMESFAEKIISQTLHKSI